MTPEGGSSQECLVRVHLNCIQKALLLTICPICMYRDSISGRNSTGWGCCMLVYFILAFMAIGFSVAVSGVFATVECVTPSTSTNACNGTLLTISVLTLIVTVVLAVLSLAILFTCCCNASKFGVPEHERQREIFERERLEDTRNGFNTGTNIETGARLVNGSDAQPRVAIGEQTVSGPVPVSGPDPVYERTLRQREQTLLEERRRERLERERQEDNQNGFSTLDETGTNTESGAVSIVNNSGADPRASTEEPNLFESDSDDRTVSQTEQELLEERRRESIERETQEDNRHRFSTLDETGTNTESGSLSFDNSLGGQPNAPTVEPIISSPDPVHDRTVRQIEHELLEDRRRTRLERERWEENRNRLSTLDEMGTITESGVPSFFNSSVAQPSAPPLVPNFSGPDSAYDRTVRQIERELLDNLRRNRLQRERREENRNLFSTLDETGTNTDLDAPNYVYNSGAQPSAPPVEPSPHADLPPSYEEALPSYEEALPSYAEVMEDEDKYIKTKTSISSNV
ncbi:uncharacterized protein LOC128245439 isoform X2 [Mya arenaria]|uniref:uncharacterized protein LOC128245439 isoform X2 n=1 Tax=Mya arenaria TaxID=6604 RepID=UPI0022E56A22|nr:uncharacterized protein LOC128245439 isoform X2 [Mya arenaria]XP_052819545.1 uncharacterized protein LOC128245439 isoform X2 [Mya arenaria]